MAAPHHRRLIVTGTEDDGDISLASTLHSPPLDDEQLQWQQQRPSQLRRASSQGAQAGRGGHRKRNSTLMRVNDLPTAVLPSELLNRMKEWIETIVIVNFDLDRELDNCYPPMSFTPAERTSIAFSSFPDHNDKGDSSLTFSWRIPRLREDGITPTETILHGFCYFCQQKNPSIRRGYAQRSLVILTKHAQLAGLFTKLVDILGQMYFRERGGGSAAVETAIHNLCRWPPPSPGTTELAFLNHILSIEIPLPHQAQFRLPRSGSYLSLANLPPPPSPASIPLLASLPSTPLSELLRELISQLWLIWELVILAEPILVYSTDPKRASEIVQWLVTIIRPLPFAGDWRPFFHIHTPDYALLLNNNKPRPGTLLGASNPLILSAARHYPHILRIGPPTPSQSLSTPVHGVFGSLAKSPSGQSFKDASTAGHSIVSERKRYIKKDTVVLKLAEEKVKAGDFSGADSHLLQCMSTLTERFLVPLNRYFATLLPADASEGMATPKKTQTFSHTGFLQSLKTHGTPLMFRRGKIPSINSSSDATATASAVAFYEKFLKSPNFLGWLRDRSETMQTTARDRYLQRLQTGNPETYLQGKGPAEMSDLIERLETEAQITEDEIRRAPPMLRQRSASYDVSMHSQLAKPNPGQILKDRSTRLRSQVERVKALRQLTLESSEDSDASAIA